MRSVLLLVILTVLSVYSCSTNKERKTDHLLIGFSQCTMGDDWRKTQIEEMRREIDLLREHSMKLVVKDAGDSNEKQIDDIHELLGMGVDLLIVSPNEARPLTPIIEEVYDAGIPVINIDRKINSQKFTAYIGAENSMIGQEAGKMAVQLLNGKGKILEITGLEGSSAAIERSGGFHEILDHYPEINIVNYEGAWLHERALELTDTLFDRNCDFDLIFAHNDPMAYGCYLSAAKHNYYPHVMGVDGLTIPEGGIDRVLDGSFSATFLYPTGGDQAVQLAYKILKGEPYKKYNFLNTLTIEKKMARTMKLQGEKISEQQEKIDRQLEYIGEIGGLLEQKQVYLLLNMIISILLIIIVGLIVLWMVQKNKLYRAVNNKNKMINEQNFLLSQQKDDLIKLLKIAEEANEEKMRFFTNISHEFRSMISLITLPLNRLMEEKCIPEAREKLLVMSRSANRLQKLAQEILRFRKIDTNRYQLMFQEIDMSEFLKEIVDTFRPKAEEKGIVLVAELPSELFVEFDASCMEKVVFNLVSNAIRHTEKNGIVYIRLEQYNSYVRIDVKDTGKGIPKEDLPFIFDRFYKGADQQGDEDGVSMGIGLALSKELLAMHGGTIKVKSKIGKGSTFVVHIPLSHPRLEETIKTGSLGYSEDHPNQIPEPESLCDKTVLIVEDNSEMRSIMAELIGKYFRVIQAADGLDALKQAIEIVPDLILSDILMPFMDGIQMTQELKKHPATFHIPVILLTAVDSQESTIKGFNTGADDYVVKPFNEGLLIRRIYNLINSRSLIRRRLEQHPFSTEGLNIQDIASKEFLNQVIKVIYENASSEDYSLNNLAEDMNLSRSSLYRRIKELTGFKAIDFLKKVRLQYAAKLLINQEYTVNEVAWRSGYSDAKYFSKCFLKEYGIVPSKFKTENSLV